MHTASFDFDVVTGPSIPEDRKPDAPKPPAPAQPASREPATHRTR